MLYRAKWVPLQRWRGTDIDCTQDGGAVKGTQDGGAVKVTSTSGSLRFVNCTFRTNLAFVCSRSSLRVECLAYSEYL